MVETRGEGAFNLDGASEPYNRGARHACLGDLLYFDEREGKIGHCRCADILVKLDVLEKTNVNQLNFYKTHLA